MPGPARPSFPSAPSEPGLRRLGVGGGSGGGGDDRPIRAQVVVAIVILLVLLAIPLYLLRRPSSHPVDAALDPSAAAAFSASVPVPAPSAKAAERLTLGTPVRVRCGSAQQKAERGAPCDQLPFFESALSAAIKKSIDCAPTEKSGGSLNYVLKIDFDKQAVHLFAGASGSIKGAKARRAVECVKQALPPPDWKTLAHQYRYYEVAILATYAAPSETTPPGAPVFQ